jgi:hypothetical protein
MLGPRTRAVALFLALTACAAAVVVDVGCNAYADARALMPPLGTDAVSEWVATTLDGGMTRACRG